MWSIEKHDSQMKKLPFYRKCSNQIMRKFRKGCSDSFNRLLVV